MNNVQEWEVQSFPWLLDLLSFPLWIQEYLHITTFSLLLLASLGLESLFHSKLLSTFLRFNKELPSRPSYQ